MKPSSFILLPARRLPGLALISSLLTVLGAGPAGAAETLIHYRVSNDDTITTTVPNLATTPGTDSGMVTGSLSLSADVPVAGVPPGEGNRSLAFDGASGITAPGTQQLLNSQILAEGGFTYEAWFKYTGGGNVNSIIDYAGTEKIHRLETSDGPQMQTNSGIIDPIASAAADEWHYVAVVFSNVTGDGASVTGDYTYSHHTDNFGVFADV